MTLRIPALCILAACLAPALAAPALAQAPPGWPAYGGAAGGGQYSPADQIDTANVAGLEQAWIYRSGDFSNGGKGARATTFEVNPILADDTLYIAPPTTGWWRWCWRPAPSSGATHRIRRWHATTTNSIR